MMYKKILVAGGHGFVGSKVSEKLEKKGLTFKALSLRDGIDFRDQEITKRLFEKELFDAIINCAAFVGGIEFGRKHPAEIYINNILMASNLMEAARRAKVKRFINPISNCTYPHRFSELKEEEWWDGPLHETVLAYGFARKASWIQSWAYNKQYGLETVNLVLPNMFGPGDHFDEVRSHALDALIVKFVEAKKKGLPKVIVWGTGKPIREWLYVDDGAEAIVKALEMAPAIDPNPINIGVGKGISTLALAEMIKNVVGYSGEIVLDPSKPDGTPCKIMNTEKMKIIFDWAPSISLEEGIRKTVRWYLEAAR